MIYFATFIFNVVVVVASAITTGIVISVIVLLLLLAAADAAAAIIFLNCVHVLHKILLVEMKSIVRFVMML